MTHVHAIVGSRNWEVDSEVHAVVDALMAEHGRHLALVSGGAEGADTMALVHACYRYGFQVRRCVQGDGAQPPRPGEFVVVRPAYRGPRDRLAPIRRNALVAYLCDGMDAFLCDPGRGTVSAIRFAASMGRPGVVTYESLSGASEPDLWVYSLDAFAYEGARPKDPRR